ncbi:MAG: hypothetical protein AB1752_08165 [Candidatus Zixiibacteriota bacterium]
MVLRIRVTGALLAALLTLAPPALSQSDASGANPALPVTAMPGDASPSELLSPDHAPWEAIAHVPVHLNRTPPLYDTDPKDDGYRPVASMQLVRRDSTLYVRLSWADATVDSIPAAKLYADAGDPAVYKRQSEVIDRFRDAACVMTPRLPPDGANPSLVMGDAGRPVTLYYWRNGDGFTIGTAAGRGSTTLSETTFPGHASHQSGQWSVVFALPMAAPSMPIAIALWDGSKEHRDGLKYYSLWYEVNP